MTELAHGNETFPAYLAKPAGDVKGGLIVIHEIWAPNDHIEISRRPLRQRRLPGGSPGPFNHDGYR